MAELCSEHQHPTWDPFQIILFQWLGEAVISCQQSFKIDVASREISKGMRGVKKMFSSLPEHYW